MSLLRVLILILQGNTGYVGCYEVAQVPIHAVSRRNFGWKCKEAWYRLPRTRRGRLKGCAMAQRTTRVLRASREVRAGL